MVQFAKIIKARITFAEEILGTASADPAIHERYIASLSEDAKKIEEEVAAIGVDEVVKNDMTVFSRNAAGEPVLWDYQLKGFFKDACSMLARVSAQVEETQEETPAAGAKKTKKKGDSAEKKTKKAKKKALNESGKILAHKKVVDGLVFVFPRQIPLKFEGKMGTCQRPLRASTAQGERIALANSETVPDGAYFDIAIGIMDANHEAAVREWLDYGMLRGLGQWRNSGKGRFLWEDLETGTGTTKEMHELLFS